MSKVDLDAASEKKADVEQVQLPEERGNELTRKFRRKSASNPGVEGNRCDPDT